MTTLIFGCVEEEEGNNSTGGNNNPVDNNGGMVVKAMDVDITNIEHNWRENTQNPLDPPDLSVSCEAINYGGPGRCTVAIVANDGNSSITVKRIIGLKANEQKELTFWGKISKEPVNITGYVERELSDAITKPKSDEMDVVIENIFPQVHKWLDKNHTELQVTIHASAINYEKPGHITLVTEVEGIGFTKTVEERIHIDWYELIDLKFDMTLPGVPVNMTINTKRPDPDA
jgi:hypothetical protein